MGHDTQKPEYWSQKKSCVVGQRLGKHVSAAIEELLEMVFSMGSDLRLYSELLLAVGIRLVDGQQVISDG
jgi:hypothetical protein